MKKFVTPIRLIFLGLFLFLLARGKIMLWLALYGASLVLALFFGRIYCGYMCPMNTVMVPTDWLSKKFNIKTDKVPGFLKSEAFTWIFLVLTIGIMLFSKRILQKDIPVLLIWIGISILVTLRYKPEVFHNLLCPFASLQKVFGGKSRNTEFVDESTCIGCKLCVKVCPAGAIEMIKDDKYAKIDNSYCHQCLSCEHVCPKDSISYTKNK